MPTYQIWQENERSHCYQQYTNDERYVICGGAYPIIVGKGMIGSVIVSGLAHNEDHQIIVDVLSKYPIRKIAILADMLELGAYEQAFHQEVGQYVAKKHIDQLMCVGPASLNIVLKAQENGIEA